MAGGRPIEIIIDANASARKTAIVETLQAAAVKAATDLQAFGHIENTQSVLIAVLPEDSNDLSDASDYFRVWLKTANSYESN